MTRDQIEFNSVDISVDDEKRDVSKPYVRIDPHINLCSIRFF